MTKMMDRHLLAMVHAHRDEVGRQGRIKPRIKLSLKARNRPAAEVRELYFLYSDM